MDAHEADLEVAVSEVGEVEVDGDRLGLLTFGGFVSRHVRDRRGNSPEVRLLEPKQKKIIQTFFITFLSIINSNCVVYVFVCSNVSE